MSMPRTVLLPRPEDFCRDRLDDEAGHCCFIGWRIKLFPNLTYVEEDEFEVIGIEVAKKMGLKKPERQTFENVAYYNDDESNSLRRLATWFRKTVEQFGYDVK